MQVVKKIFGGKTIDKTGGTYRLLENQTQDGGFFWEIFERMHK